MSLSEPPIASLLVPGYHLERYELLCPIAEGGMAAVWLAQRRGKHGFRKLVAIKTILPRYTAEPGFRTMFLDEANVSSRVEHANVAQVLDLGEQHELLYLVMEWVDGDSLLKLEKTVIKKGLALPQGILLRTLTDACAGLHAAHELRDEGDGHLLSVVHRDVSPQNLLVSPQGVTKVIDFGIAKARNRSMHDTTAGVVKGKLNYMSPEQALGQAVDRRADIWAIGAIFYRIVKGKAAFDASNLTEISRLIETGILPDALTTDDAHPAVLAVMEKALHPDLSRRFATALEMRDAIEAAAKAAGIAATTDDVAAYIAIHLEDRALARKNAIQAALDASSARESLSKSLKAPTPSSNGRIAPLHSVAIDPPVDVHPRGPTARPENAGSETDDSTPIIQHKDIRPWMPESLPRRLLPLAVAGLVAALGTMMFMTHGEREQPRRAAESVTGEGIPRSASTAMSTSMSTTSATPTTAASTAGAASGPASAGVDPVRAAPEPRSRVSESPNRIGTATAVTPPAAAPRPPTSGARGVAPKAPALPAHPDDQDGI